MSLIELLAALALSSRCGRMHRCTASDVCDAPPLCRMLALPGSGAGVVLDSSMPHLQLALPRLAPRICYLDRVLHCLRALLLCEEGLAPELWVQWDG